MAEVLLSLLFLPEECMSPKQLDHFLDVITSAHIVQDLPFGEKTLKLSTKEEIAVPNVIRTLIPSE